MVLGVTMLAGFAQINLPLSLWTVGMGHVVINLPVVILIVMARCRGWTPIWKRPPWTWARPISARSGA